MAHNNRTYIIVDIVGLEAALISNGLTLDYVVDRVMELDTKNIRRNNDLTKLIAKFDKKAHINQVGIRLITSHEVRIGSR